MRAAQSDVNAHSKELADNATAIEEKKRAVAQEQRDLAAKEALLVEQREQLGSAQGDLQAARGAYAAAVKQRFAKLEPLLATLATRSDAASRDAAAGLRARHDQLASKISAMGATPDAGWVDYTKDVDTTFDAIEKDLHAAVELPCPAGGQSDRLAYPRGIR